MALNVDCYDVEKYQLKWLKVLGYAKRTWVRVLCMSFVCYFKLIIILIICLIMMRDNIILELQELS